MASSGVDQLLPQARAMFASLGSKRLVGIALAGLAVVVAISGTTYWASQPTWALLATDVDPEGMNGVVERLKTLKVPYQLDPGGRTVRVDASRADELRMQMAASGLPASGRIGFELFDRTMFGATELTEKVNFQRALEGELARTISSLSTVSGARVHLVLPKNSLFATESQPAKASVVLRLRTGRTVSAGEVDGIVALVASSVEGLPQDGVTVLDANGRRLSRQTDTGESIMDRGRFERQQQLEKDLAMRVVALLEPVVGAGRVRANVSANLKADSEDEMEERWDPTSVVRSRQQTMEADGRPVAQGAAGAQANIPQGATAAPEPPKPPAAMATNNKTSEVTNYEVSKLTRHRVSPAGQLNRLSVAVLIDDVRKVEKAEDGKETTVATPRTPEELQRLHTLVASAVGLVPDRGDQLTVENIAFEVTDGPFVTAPEAPRPSGQVVTELFMQNWKIAVPAIAVVFLLIGGVVYMRRGKRRTAVTSTGAMAGQRLASASGAPVPAMAGASAGTDSGPDVALPPSPARQLARLAQAEPEQLARIVRGWLAEEERER
ncbi:MAG: flagellar M-ring protein FliF [Acidobacteria bacterium]|nr:flagellar M-ring protein FliF [Acidobacteriota bacterium]